ncbi:MAG: hypothetical protein COV59_02975 [Candidatus Magasanikbacteria bacterium CG11_big_fil_rev_8_21_14_0_20_39_34]|uniref:M23ase beta-sheet core domain-containing protein n=1 Tax=Candidatus Magasanikbacteria bacterium CG11_big_fil_rev_8_21_14_0_20_39_34 TaxID=1974653 RepID=A0A2H0N5G1_9BACT|nr:MAG: hypothetical protein COV59_02975 [Candidatus Magasanikbacteria bacterium CG11_big_fil_rev_8_21_14_0_20_39_34]
MNIKKFTILLSLCIVFLAVPYFVISVNAAGNSTQAEVDQLNQEIEARQSKIKQIEDSILQYKKKIEETRLEKVSLDNQLSILQNRVTGVELDIKLINEKLDTINLQIEKLQFEIAEKEKSIEIQKVISAELIRTLHKNGGRNLVEILAVYDSFSSFYNKLQYLKTVETNLADTTKSLKIAKADLEGEKEETKQRRLAYKDLEDKLSERKKDLEEQAFAKEDILIKTKNSEKVYETLVENLKRQYQDTESEITGFEKQIRQKLEEQKKLESFPPAEQDFGNKLSWPTQSRYLTAYFHDPDYPFRNVFEHTGIDIRAAQATPIKAAGTGYIGRAKHCSASTCYSYVMVIHPGGLATVYGHLSKILVNEEGFVSRGDIIGYSGGTPGTAGAGPFVTGPHLHFEVRLNGIPVNPLDYLIRDWDE